MRRCFRTTLVRCIASTPPRADLPRLNAVLSKVLPSTVPPSPLALKKARKPYVLKAAEKYALEIQRTLPPYALPKRLGAPRLSVTTAQVDEFLSRVRASQDRLTAFDMEWNTSTQKGSERRTGLMQIAHSEAGILLYSVPRTTTATLPQSLQDYFAAEDIYKAGVQIRGDALKLRRDWPELPALAGQIEINTVVRLVDPDRYATFQGPLASLQRLTAIYCGRYLHKGDVRRSNWEGSGLKPENLQYASKDVQATLDILIALQEIAAQKGITVDWAQLAGKLETKGGSALLAPRAQEAWNIVFSKDAASESEAREVDRAQIATAAGCMNIKERSVFMYCLAAAERSPDMLSSITPRQAEQFAALTGHYFAPGVPANLAVPLLAFGKRAAATT